MPGAIATIPKFLFSANGEPLVGGTLYTYVAGTTTPAETWQDQALTVSNTNPIILDTRGECVLWLDPDAVYKFVLKDTFSVVQWTVDNISGASPASVLSQLAAVTGAAMIGGGSQVVASIAALRALLKTSASQNAFVTGYYAAGDGGGGAYWYDASDTTTADNGGTCIVAADGGRWKLCHQGTISVRQFGAKGDGTTNDAAAIQAAINSGVRRIYIPSGRFKCLSTLNLCNLAVTGVPLKLFGDGVCYDNGSLSAGSVILSNPGAGNWVAELVGSQFVTIEDIMIVSTGADAALGGLLYARSTLAGFAQNNALRRCIIKIASGGGSMAVGNNCAEEFVMDECWLEADIPYVSTLANEQGFVAQHATIANVTYSCTKQMVRATNFAALTSTSMILTGVASANFDACSWIPAAGNVYAHGITLRSSIQGYQDCQNITFTGQVESFPNALRLEGQSRNIEFKVSTSNVTGATVNAFNGTLHYNLTLATNPLNTTGLNVIEASAGTVTLHGGRVVIPPNMKQIDTGVKFSGTDIDATNGNLNSAAFFACNSASSYHARWSNSKTFASVAWNPGGVAANTTTATTFAVTGAAVGDKVDVIFPYASQSCLVQGSVDAANLVRITLANTTGGLCTFLAGTWKVQIERPAA